VQEKALRRRLQEQDIALRTDSDKQSSEDEDMSPSVTKTMTVIMK
jgi:hypothetical protein